MGRGAEANLDAVGGGVVEQAGRQCLEPRVLHPDLTASAAPEAGVQRDSDQEGEHMPHAEEQPQRKAV